MPGSHIKERLFKKGRSNGQYRHGNAHLIELRQVVKTYKSASSTFTALNGVDLMVDKGEFIAVVGKSGSGKSTLLNMLTGIDHPTSGEVYVGDTAVHKLSENKMAIWRGLNVGIVFQFFQLLPTLTVVENILLPMDFCHKFSSRERYRRAVYLLEQVDLIDQAHKLPASLSGGQQQRVAIARALATDPPLLVADEPTGNLDSMTAQSIFSLFESLIDQGKTIVMVTHDEDLAQRITRTIYLSDGEIAGDHRLAPIFNPQETGFDLHNGVGIYSGWDKKAVRERVMNMLRDPDNAVKRLREEFQRAPKNPKVTEILYSTILESIRERAIKEENTGRREEARDLWKILVEATAPFVNKESETGEARVSDPSIPSQQKPVID